MRSRSHSSATSSHYDEEAKHYDAFNEKNSQLINATIEKILKKYRVHTVLDLTCGTGSQVFYLVKRGYEVVGSDINSKMLQIAKQKAKKEKLDIRFLQKDMRGAKIGKFDAVITIFNAVGHLTKADFEKAMRNIYDNLHDGGLYIFDINNLSYLLKDNQITELTIDWQKTTGSTKARVIQYSTIDATGCLASYTTSYEQKGSQKPKKSESAQTLQVYTAKQLKEMLQRTGFTTLHQLSIDGSKFMDTKSDRILTVAKKSKKIKAI